MDNFVVIGNPIKHSKSPRIHQLFSQHTGKQLNYTTCLAEPERFEETLADFFMQGGLGANITMPFKEQAFRYCHSLTPRAELAGAVNTVKPLSEGHLLGDNTDGIGLVSDLQRLLMLKAHCRILLIGAGGAARGIILPLLELGHHITITNRTYPKAQMLADVFTPHGCIYAKPLHEIVTPEYELIINATSAGVNDTVPELDSCVLTPQVKCYDLFYQKGDTAFVYWAKIHGCHACADGLGMLVAQAAHAFYLWHGVMPEIEPVLNQLRQELEA